MAHALLCGECGRLGWRASAGPHRHEPTTSLERQPACPHCGHRSWMDLGRESIASRIRDHEESRVARRRHDRDAVRYGLLAGVFGLGWGMSNGGGATVGIAFGLFAGLVAGASSYFVARPDGGPPSSRPARWALALPPDGEATEVVRGPARPIDEVLFAPFSGRRCVAYEVGARFDRKTDAPLNTWALLEQRIAPVEVGGREVDVDAAYLRLPRTRLGRSSKLALGEAALAFLAQRGLDAHSLAFELFEEIVDVDEEVELRAHAGGGVSLVAGLEGTVDPRVDDWPARALPPAPV